MRKLISTKMIFLYLLIILSIILIFNKNNQSNITYLSLGDSYAKGRDCFGINDYGYSDYLKDKLKGNKNLRRYINNYSDNDIDLDMQKNNITNNQIIVLKKQKMYLKEALQEADILTLSIGMNDLRYKFLLNEDIDYKKFDEELALIQNNFDLLIKEIRKYYKKDIYVIGYPNIILENYYLSMAIRRYNNYLRNYNDITYISVDMLEYDKENYFLNPNSNHYNRDGYQRISEDIFKKIEKNLKNN